MGGSVKLPDWMLKSFADDKARARRESSRRQALMLRVYADRRPSGSGTTTAMRKAADTIEWLLEQ